jgi:hypothetical protein
MPHEARQRSLLNSVRKKKKSYRHYVVAPDRGLNKTLATKRSSSTERSLLNKTAAISQTNLEKRSENLPPENNFV